VRSESDVLSATCYGLPIKLTGFAGTSNTLTTKGTKNTKRFFLPLICTNETLMKSVDDLFYTVKLNPQHGLLN